MKIKFNPKLAVIRGSQPRMSEISFYSRFKHFDVRVIGDRTTGWIDNKNIPASLKFIHSPLVPVWGIDPWTGIFGKYHAHRSFQYVKSLEKLVSDADVLNISDLFYFYCWQSAQIAKRTNKKLSVIVWETIPRHITTYLPPYAFGVKAVRDQADLFIARSFLARNYLLSIGADPAKIKVIYKGIDLKTFKPSGVKHRNHGKIKILYVGQLVKSKGIYTLLDVFAKLYKKHPQLELCLLGRSEGEPLEKMLISVSSRLPVTVKSQVAYDKLVKYYQEADIYCHLSQDTDYLPFIKGWNEWFSYAIIEAMSCGLPIVASHCGGIAEQIKDPRQLVPQKNTQATLAALEKLILNPKLRNYLGRRNRQRAEAEFEINRQSMLTETAMLDII